MLNFLDTFSMGVTSPDLNSEPKIMKLVPKCPKFR